MADAKTVEADFKRQRRVKNLLTALMLLVMMAAIYGLTIVRLEQGLENRLKLEQQP